MIKKILVFLIIPAFLLQMSFISNVRAQKSSSYLLNKNEKTYKSGSVFFTSNKKNEVLLKVNIWGAVQFPGVHYVPMGTRFLDAISYAGGPLELANSDEISLTSSKDSKLSTKELSLKTALTKQDNNPVLSAEDIIIVKEDRSEEKVKLWLSIGTFVLSLAAFGVLLDKN